MKVKVCPVCPVCKAPHDQEVDPGTKVRCPDCDEVYRAEAPEPSNGVARPLDRSGKRTPAADKDDPPAAKKKPRARGADKLGKLIEVFTPSGKRALLLTVAILAGLFGVGIAVYGLVGVDADVRPWMLGVGGVLGLVTAVCLLMLRFGGSGAVFEVRKKGVRYKTRKTEQFLFWEEIENIDIRRVTMIAGTRTKTKYEVYLIGSETIHLTNAFLGSLDDPNGLIRALKRYSGKDFEMVFE